MRSGIAVVLLCSFGCTALRARTGPIEQVLTVQGASARSDIDLWLESGDPLSEAELAAARERAQRTLEEALQSVTVAPSPMDASDPVLVFRERGVSRTASRRRDQVAGTVGLVVGAVVVVAVLVALATQEKSAPAAPPAASTKPLAASAQGAPAAPQAKPPSHPRARPKPPPSAPRLVPPPPGPLVSVPYANRSPSFWDSLDLGFEAGWLPSPSAEPGDGSTEDAEAEEPPPPPAEAPALELPPSPDVDVSGRGFFSGDESLLEVDLLDGADGKLLWSKTVRGGDPLDPDDVRKLVRDAFAGVAWVFELQPPPRRPLPSR